ncbi:arm repeat superfamily protein-related [Anaeramoeba flamelloides]|uniref:Arm repeat superfamily protein-related n=1 Tax=Anaeramoeba flamelloides TaxID=1746091 RepID=A0AAV7ZD41_9EUKA|nr:arm repeat superfamily protein-related [Anaeramoeba flamelloides]
MSNFEKKLKNRQKNFKKKSDREVSVKRRNKINIQTSKKARERILKSNRKIFDSNLSTKNLTDKQINDQIIHLIQNFNNSQKNQLQTLRKFQEILYFKSEPAINSMIENGIVTHLSGLLSLQTLDEIKIDSLLIISTFCSSTEDHTKHVVEGGLVPIIMDLFDSTNPKILKQTWKGVYSKQIFSFRGQTRKITISR